MVDTVTHPQLSGKQGTETSPDACKPKKNVHVSSKQLQRLLPRSSKTIKLQLLFYANLKHQASTEQITQSEKHRK